MKNTLKITLKANERIYVNGAVIKTDRKVSLEFLNDVQFLLEGHVLQAEEANTPLRQLYFAVQIVLMDPPMADEARALIRRSMPLLLACYADESIRSTVKHVDQLVGEGHVFEALKAIRALYSREAELLAGEPHGAENFKLVAAE